MHPAPPNYYKLQRPSSIGSAAPPPADRTQPQCSSASTRPSFSFSFLLRWLHSGGTSISSSSSLSPCSLFLCTLVGLCSAGEYTVYKIKGVGPVLINWCCVPAGTMIRSPALTSWSTPAIVALPLPEVNVKIWSTVCFWKVQELAVSTGLACSKAGSQHSTSRRIHVPHPQSRRRLARSLVPIENTNPSTAPDEILLTRSVAIGSCQGSMPFHAWADLQMALETSSWWWWWSKTS